MKRVLVTGATGFIGRHLCRHLVTNGWRVRAACRFKPAPGVLPVEVECAETGDIFQKFDWRSLLQGVDGVVHLVARTHIVQEHGTQSLNAYRRVNVEGTRQLIQHCVDAAVSRFVFMSSIKAVGEGASGAYRESTPCDPVDAYGITKLEAERVVHRVARDTNLATVILRPPLVYGPHVSGNFLRLMQLAGRSLPLPVASLRNARSLVYVENLVWAIDAALQHPNAVNQTFHVADDEVLSTSELVARLAALQGKSPLLLPIPVSLLQLGGAVVGRSQEVTKLASTLTISCEKIKRRLGWRPPVTSAEGFQRTVAWFNSLTGRLAA